MYVFVAYSARTIRMNTEILAELHFSFFFPFLNFFFLSSFLFFFLSFSLFPFLVPFSFVLSFRLVVFAFVSCIEFFAFLFASMLSLVADSASRLFRLGANPAPRSLRAWSMRIPLACCLLALLMLTYSCFLLFLPFFDFDSDIVCFILSFSCGCYAVSSVSVSAATRLAYNTYLDTYVR